jgi:hypothetical protein
MSPDESSAFTFYDRLITGFAEAADGGRPLYELAAPKRPLVKDLSHLPPDATFLRTADTPKSLGRLEAAARLVAVWASSPSPALLEVIARLPRLRAVYVQNLRRVDIRPLARCVSVEHLLVTWAPNQADIGFLSDMPSLRTLSLDDLKRLNLETLPSLPNLTALNLSGGIWSTLKIPSLAPLDRLPNLRYLMLSNVRPADRRLMPLAKLQQLRTLELPNFFELEEFARLAAALPETRGRALTPFFTEARTDSRGEPVFACKQCGGSKVMMTGRPAVVLCSSCDSAKIAKRVTRWELAYSAQSAQESRTRGGA